MTSRDVAGRPVCQVEGCQEPATPWGTVYTLGFALDVRLILCRRHASDLDQALREAMA